MISGRFIEDMNLSLGLDWLLSQYTLDRRRGNTVSPGDLADALALATVTLDGSIIEYQRLTADALTFQTGAACRRVLFQRSGCVPIQQRRRR